jgi:hypothetical protein
MLIDPYDGSLVPRSDVNVRRSGQRVAAHRSRPVTRRSTGSSPIPGRYASNDINALVLLAAASEAMR